MNPYVIIIGGGAVLLLSFLFNKLAARLGIPSVIPLVALGIILKYSLSSMGFDQLDLFPFLEIVGIVGLILIVLEATLELKLSKDKIRIMIRAALTGLLGMVTTAFLGAYLIIVFIPEMEFLHALLHATPFSVISSAIVIPSVVDLDQNVKEELIYESTFSDIFGIMMFYLVLSICDNHEIDPHITVSNEIIEFLIGLVVTICVGLIAGYTLISLFQHVVQGPKLFLIMAILLIVYATGKLAHLSPLMIILIFGLMLSNSKTFFRWRMSGLIKEDKFPDLEQGMHTLTIETSFVLRTFFFVMFGATIALGSLANFEVLVIGSALLVLAYSVRWLLLKMFFVKKVIPQLWIAPRGLISILLFYSIPEKYLLYEFDSGVLLLVILGSCLVMMVGMFQSRLLKHPLLDEEPMPVMDESKDNVEQFERQNGEGGH